MIGNHAYSRVILWPHLLFSLCMQANTLLLYTFPFLYFYFPSIPTTTFLSFLTSTYSICCILSPWLVVTLVGYLCYPLTSSEGLHVSSCLLYLHSHLVIVCVCFHLWKSCLNLSMQITILRTQMCELLFCTVFPWPVSPNTLMQAGHLDQFGPYGADGKYSGKEEWGHYYVCGLVLTVFWLAERP